MKRIAIVAHGLDDGGAERVAALLANQFLHMGNEVLFVAAYSPKREYVLDEGIEYTYIETSKKNRYCKMLDRAKKIEHAVASYRADVVVSFIINEMIICNIRKTAPIIYSLRIDPARVTKKFLNRVLCIYSYKRAKRVAFQTEDAKNFFPSPIREKGVVIGNPLTPNLPCWKDNEHDQTIITACRLTKQKNLKMLIGAFARAHERFPDYTLKIYGRGPLQEELERYSEELEISDCVVFPGYSKDIHNVMAQSAVFALTSDYEGLSNSMLEALAIGIPTICTDCPPGGAAEYIRNGVNGLLVPIRDVEALYQGFCKLLSDEDFCRNISKESVKIREKLSVQGIIEKWSRLLDEE